MTARTPTHLTAITLQYIMIGIILLALAGIGFVFVAANNILLAKATETDHSRIDAEIAQEDLSRLKQLKSILENDKATIAKTAQIVADSQSYKYQDQVINDLTEYARQADISILGFDFGAKPGDAPTAKGSGTSQRRTIVIVQLAGNIPYASILRLLKSIEQNVTKMQLTGINFQPLQTDPNIILGSSLEIEVYLR